MSKDLELFNHSFIDNQASRTIFFLHGTGGTEHDFLFFDELVDKKFNLVGIRGNVREQGMNRFFIRSSLGIFNQESIKKEADKLFVFTQAFIKKRQQATKDITFVGYSNGANIALASLFYHTDIAYTFALLHPMLPFEPDIKSLDLQKHHVLVTYGENDVMIPPVKSQKLITTLEEVKTKLTIKKYMGGHEITETEIQDVVRFLKWANHNGDGVGEE